MKRIDDSTLGNRNKHNAGRAACAVLCALAVAVTGGCAKQVEQPPNFAIPANWHSDTPFAPASKDSERQGGWWYRFSDPNLDRLIQAVLARNGSLAEATLNVRQAQLVAASQGNAFLLGPQLTVNATEGRRLSNSRTVRNQSSSLGMLASYTVDLWGRLAHERDIARWALNASQADRETVRLNVIATTADLYWTLGYYNQRVAAAQHALQNAIRTQELVQAQAVAGAVSALEKREAEQIVLTQRSSLSQLRQSRAETRNALAILFNAAPGSDELRQVLGNEPQGLPDGELPKVAAGLPASLLARRPDLRSAELALRQSRANIEVVRTQYYPELSLTGMLGSVSPALSAWLANPAATVGGALSMPFVDVPTQRRHTELARLQYRTSIITFRQLLYQALADVENALSARERLTERAELESQNLVAARETERLYAIRYTAGAVALRFWLDAQETLRTAELKVAQVKLSQLQNLNALYLALGGDPPDRRSTKSPLHVPAGS